MNFPRNVLTNLLTNLIDFIEIAGVGGGGGFTLFLAPSPTSSFFLWRNNEIFSHCLSTEDLDAQQAPQGLSSYPTDL